MASVTTSRPTDYAGETLHNVDWSTYCKLRDDPANDHIRMMYLDGALTIMSPHLVHDYESRGIMVIVMIVARASRVRYMPVGDNDPPQERPSATPGSG